jgi:RNA polymerase sigma-70 factor, ECF subfamily
MLPTNRQLKLLKSKDQKAFEAIYHETKHAVYAMVLPIVRDRSLAEDVMQDTYIKMVENIHSYNPKYKFINWLLTIAKNTALDMYRTRQKEVSLHDETLDFIESRETSEDKKIDASYYLSLLTKEEQTIVLLKTVGELTHKDIAYQLNKPIGTITWQYNQAIKKMREAGKEHHHEK